jgi:magnesium chelatase family protein
MPGEISIAHNGVLFLDELPEFRRSALEVMRQPIEDGYVSISRSRMSVTYPSRFMLVASMNPSPKGDWGNEGTEEDQKLARKYRARISGPLLDRIDLHIEVNKVTFDDLTTRQSAESSATIRDRVICARQLQDRRFLGMPGIYSNAQMHTRLVRRMCKIDESGSSLLKMAMQKMGLSARAYDRILKVSRSIADLAHSDTIQPVHLAEAIQYRSLDRDGW